MVTCEAGWVEDGGGVTVVDGVFVQGGGLSCERSH